MLLIMLIATRLPPRHLQDNHELQLVPWRPAEDLLCMQAAPAEVQKSEQRTCQGLVSLCDGLGKVLGSRGVRVLIRMVNQRQLPVSLFHLLVCCPSVNLHHSQTSIWIHDTGKITVLEYGELLSSCTRIAGADALGIPQSSIWRAGVSPSGFQRGQRVRGLRSGSAHTTPGQPIPATQQPAARSGL